MDPVSDRQALFTLRPAIQADDRAIKDLIHRVGINPMALDWHRFILAVTPAGELAGCGQVKPHGDGTRELASIAVAEGFRGQGVARLVIEHLLAENPGTLYLTCRASLGPLYEKFGFRALHPGEFPPYFKRLFRLVRVFGKLGLNPEGLLVMKRE